METRRAGPALLHENKRNHHRESGHEHEEKNPDGTTPIILAETGSLERLGQLLQTLVHRCKFGWRQDARDHRWQRFRYDTLRFFWIGRFAHGAKR